MTPSDDPTALLIGMMTPSSISSPGAVSPGCGAVKCTPFRMTLADLMVREKSRLTLQLGVFRTLDSLGGGLFQIVDPLRVVGVSAKGPQTMAASASGAVAKMVAINAETAVSVEWNGLGFFMVVMFFRCFPYTHLVCLLHEVSSIKSSK